MKDIIYEGPSPVVNVVVDGDPIEHVQGAVMPYPDDVADELVNASSRQKFRYAEEKPRKPEKPKKTDRGE